jgi:hypothetical protein
MKIAQQHRLKYSVLMRRLRAICLTLAAVTLLVAGCSTTGPRPLAWDVLPYPRDSDWPAWSGVPGNLEGETLVLQGHPVRTHETYSAPLTVECEVELEARVAADGFFGVGFVPVGAPPDVGPLNLRWLQIACRGSSAASGRDALAFLARDGSVKDRLVWGEKPFAVTAGKPCTVRLEVAEDGIRVVVDGRAYDLKGVKIPYNRFHIWLDGWQPTNRWRVRNFVIH